MAGDWLKVELSLADKPEVWEIASELDIDPDAVVGKLIRVWSWFDEQTETGNAPSVTKKLLDRRVGVNGFCDAMFEAGWMHDDGQIISLPNFERHNGKTAKNRALTAKRVANHKNKSNDKTNGASVKTALPREEKRRVKEHSLRSCSAPSDKSHDASPPAEVPDDPIVEQIPLNDGTEHPVHQSEVEEYERLYPAVDVPQALRNIRGWAIGNPSKRKTRRGIKKHITGWLASDQDKGGLPTIGGRNGATSSGNNPKPQSATERFWDYFGSEVSNG